MILSAPGSELGLSERDMVVEARPGNRTLTVMPLDSKSFAMAIVKASSVLLEWA